MRFKQYLNEGSIKNILSGIGKMSSGKMKTVFKKSFDKMIKIIIDNNIESDFLNIINKNLKTNYKSLKQLQALKESNLNEDFKNFLTFWKGETFPALSIFPTLQIWFEIDKLFSGVNIVDLDWKKMAVYGLLWILILTGQHIRLFKKWKKENPQDWENEGKPGIFKKGKKEDI